MGKYDTFRNRTNAENTLFHKNNADFLTQSLSSTLIDHLRTEEQFKGVLTKEQEEGVDKIILFTPIFDQDEENVQIGDYIQNHNTIYLVYMEYNLPDKLKLVYKKFRLIETNINIKVDHIAQRAAYIGSLSKYVGLRAETAGNIKFNLENYQPLVITANNDELVIGTRFSIGKESFEINGLDRISNRGILYLSVKPVPSNITLDDFEQGIAITPSAPTPPVVPDGALEQGSIENLAIYNGYVVFSPKVEIVEKTLSSVSFIVPFGIDNLTITTKDLEGDLVQTNYKVVI
jgi:hypothetical protein